MRKMRVSIRNKHIIYGDLWTTSRLLFEQGKIDANRKNKYFFFSSIIFTSFTLEAFLNHIGEELFPFWETMGKLPPKGKINIICDKLKIPVNYQCAPWSKIPEIFAFRNTSAHGKTTVKTEERIIDYGSFDELLQKGLIPRWSKYSSEQNAASARNEVENIMRTIFTAAGKKNQILFLSAYSDVTGTPCDENADGR